MRKMPNPPPPMLREIRDAVCFRFNLRESDLLAETRVRDVARPRQIGMYLARRMTRRSYVEIARAFGKGDHSTAIWADATIGRLRNSDPELGEHLRAVRFMAEAMAMHRVARAFASRCAPPANDDGQRWADEVHGDMS